MTDKEMMTLYISLTPFIAEVCGKGCEIVIHDVNNKKNSLVSIQNSSTGREIGDSLTDLAKEIIESGEYKTKDYLSGYSGLTKQKEYLSFTYFIKNNNKLIGLLCVNKDMSATKNFTKSLNELFEQFNIAAASSDKVKENLDSSVSEILEDKISTAIANTNLSPDRMSRQEKINLVRRLEEQGILIMKGAVTEIAKQLDISEPTVYRYLKS